MSGARGHGRPGSLPGPWLVAEAVENSRIATDPGNLLTRDGHDEVRHLSESLQHVVAVTVVLIDVDPWWNGS